MSHVACIHLPRTGLQRPASRTGLGRAVLLTVLPSGSARRSISRMPGGKASPGHFSGRRWECWLPLHPPTASLRPRQPTADRLGTAQRSCPRSPASVCPEAEGCRLHCFGAAGSMSGSVCGLTGSRGLKSPAWFYLLCEAVSEHSNSSCTYGVPTVCLPRRMSFT